MGRFLGIFHDHARVFRRSGKLPSVVTDSVFILQRSKNMHCERYYVVKSRYERTAHLPEKESMMLWISLILLLLDYTLHTLHAMLCYTSRELKNFHDHDLATPSFTMDSVVLSTSIVVPTLHKIEMELLLLVLIHTFIHLILYLHYHILFSSMFHPFRKTDNKIPAARPNGPSLARPSPLP
jgi:hypothetical protein